MHNEEWSGTRVAAVLASLRDAGIPESRLARLSGVNRSQVNRWSRGEHRPGYDAVRKLAVAVWRDHPAAARELVIASGYPWTEPQEIPEPRPEDLIPADVLAVIRKRYPPEQQQQVIEALVRLGEPTESPEAGESREGPARRAG